MDVQIYAAIYEQQTGHKIPLPIYIMSVFISIILRNPVHQYINLGIHFPGNSFLEFSSWRWGEKALHHNMLLPNLLGALGVRRGKAFLQDAEVSVMSIMSNRERTDTYAQRKAKMQNRKSRARQ